MNLSDQFLSKDNSKLFVTLGFNDECFGIHDVSGKIKIGEDANYCMGTPALTHQQATDYLRDNHNLHIHIQINQFGYGYMFSILDTKQCSCVKYMKGGVNYKYTYYQALNTAIEECLIIAFNRQEPSYIV